MQAVVTEREPFATYAASPEAHATMLRHLLISPRAYRAKLAEDGADSDAQRLGRAVHTAVLEPVRFLADYVLWEGGRRFGREWQAFRAAHASKTILTRDQYELALRIQEAVRSHPIAAEHLSGKGKAEFSIRWVHERTGVKIKCRLDWLAAVLLDLKTTKDPAPARFSGDAARYGYALQLALYADAVAAAGLGTPPVKIVAVQSSAPFDVVVYSLDEQLLLVGRELYERALDTLIDCTRTGEWPGQAWAEEVPLRLPAWAVPESDEEPIMFGEQAIT